jgi:UDP-N-acetyl-D-glucosamine dehydrogenase
MALLEEKGARVAYNDPHIPRIRPSREFARYAGRESAPVSGDWDLVILCTAHDPYKRIDSASLGAPILDTRGFFPDVPGRVYRG